ncbi:uncharacterized protein LOC131172198 [Hevea brasiliensis]|uniref:uncharacterized protein LOC131172198 n=1 Tax=Hevea brasiliensis TaxID=3981 RepID=UPI0025D1E0FD|nr:uncharacterized protein LOC131172198 [Hevea brasiliensis]
MPSYAKFLKEILLNKRRLEDYETVALTEECSALLQNKLPPKLKDPGSFSIPCHIGDTSIEKALCDLGASVSLMPLSICEKLKVGDLKPTTISLQLANRSIKYPVGILENVPLEVGKFFIPVDFVVLEMEEDIRIPLILSCLGGFVGLLLVIWVCVGLLYEGVSVLGYKLQPPGAEGGDQGLAQH